MPKPINTTVVSFEGNSHQIQMLLLVTMDDGSTWFGRTDLLEKPNAGTFVKLELGPHITPR